MLKEPRKESFPLFAFLKNKIMRSSMMVGLCTIAVIVTALMLMLPAITLSEDVFCGLEEHQHSEECYSKILICEDESQEHEHLDTCYEEQIVCELEEHTHEVACYKEVEYFCGMQEHIHDESCEKECELEEHVHDENCICEGLKENEVVEEENLEQTKDDIKVQDEVVIDDIPFTQAVTERQTYAIVSIQNVSDLDGQSFALVAQSRNPAALSVVDPSTVEGYNKNPNTLLLGTSVSITNNQFTKENIELFKFIQQDSGDFYIQTMDSKYLIVESSGLYISDDPLEMRVEAYTYNGLLGISIRNPQNYYRLDWYGQNGEEDYFGTWPNQNPSHNQVITCYQAISGMTFDVNGNAFLETSSWETNNSPAVDNASISYSAGDSGTLPIIKNANAEGRFVAVTTQTGSWDNVSIQNVIQKMKDANLPYGKTYEFEGWEADIDGTNYLFAEGSAYTVDASGHLILTDVDGVVHTITSSSVQFKARYKEVCDVFLMFVNYSGTILDTENNVQGRNQGLFTGVVAIGNIYYGKQTVGRDDTFAMLTDQTIKGYFRHEVDLEDESTQIVVSHLARVENGNVTHVRSAGANPTEVEATVLKYLKDNDETIKLSAKDPEDERPSLDPQNADTDHYSILWYVAKEQSDFWHIDGVLVAKTTEINVIKSFTGLTDEQAKSILDNDFGIEVFIGEGTSTNSLGQRYLTLGAEVKEGQENQYQYLGYNPDTNTARWSIRALRDEYYAVQEVNQNIAGKSCSPGIVVQSESAYSIDFNEYSVSGLVGGDTISVSFNNFYTDEEKGILPVIKRDGSQALETQHGATLPGAVFDLYNASGELVASRTTTSQGLAYFSELSTGLYTLVESKAPNGFIEPDFVALVKVEAKNNGIIVTVSSDNMVIEDSDPIVFDTVNNNGIQGFYYVDNTPNPNTMTITKTFKGVTTAELDAWVAEDALLDESQRYQIRIYNEGTGKEEILTLDEVDNVVQASNMFTWRVSGLDYGRFTVTEMNYTHEDYRDTIVEATVNDEEQEITFTNDAAMITFDVSPRSSDVIRLTNTYTNYFDLYLRKVDSITNTPLEGAVFKLYGAYDEATDTSQTLMYEGQKYFYISEIVSDENGYAIQKDLNLSAEGETFVYVLDEIASPEYYQKLDEPIQVSVTVDSENYHNNIFTTKAPNTRVNQTLEITKQISGEQAQYVPEDVLYHMQIDFYDETGTLDTIHEYPYVIYNSDDSIYLEGILTSTNNTFTLQKDQRIYFSEVPVFYEYELKETNATLYGAENITLNDVALSTVTFNAFSQAFETNEGALLSSSARKIRGKILPNGENEVVNEVTLTNQIPREEVYTNFSVTKTWNETHESYPDVTIELYRKSILEDVSTMELIDTIILNEDNHWTNAWNQQVVYGENGETYLYYLREIPIVGYRGEYNETLEEMELDDGSKVNLVLASGGKQIEINNVKVFYIPETGGRGSHNYLMLGMILMWIGLYGFKRKKCKMH